MAATQQQQQAKINTDTSTFGAGPDADLAARLAAPASPTTKRAAEEARRRTSDWKPQPQRNVSFDREEYKRQMMSDSGSLQKD